MSLYKTEKAIGRGGRLTDEAYENKKQQALAMHKPDAEDIVDIIPKVGGLDIAAMTSVFIGAAYYRKPVDDVISIAAALLAYKFNQLTKEFMFPSHISDIRRACAL